MVDPASSTCARCYKCHQSCIRNTTTGICNRCIVGDDQGVSGITHTNLREQTFPRPVLQAYLFLDATASILPLDTYNMDSNVLNVTFMTTDRASKVQMTELSLNPREDFSISNIPLIASIDGHLDRSFAAALKARAGDSKSISRAALACAYARCLYSTTDIKEHVEIYLDGILRDEDYQAGSVGPQFVLLLFDRLAEIVGDLLALVRQADRGEASQYESSHTYAAAVILHHELCFLHESLRHGHLRVILLFGFPDEVVSWLVSVKDELSKYIRRGCCKNLLWREPIRGSLKKFNEDHRGEIFEIVVSLQQNLFVMPKDELGSSPLPEMIGIASPSMPTLPGPNIDLLLHMGPVQHASNPGISSNPMDFASIPPQVPEPLDFAAMHSSGQMSAMFPVESVEMGYGLTLPFNDWFDINSNHL